MRITNTELKQLNEKGFFNRYKDAEPTFTQLNIGMPAGILSSLNTQVVENILSYRSGDEALGKREKLLDWSDNSYYTPLIERTGQTTPYSDYGMPLLVGMNLNFNEVGHYRFSTKFNFANLESEQISKAKINYSDMLLSATSEALAVELNRTAFNGYIENSGGRFLCYGLLNNPDLPNYETSAKKFNAMSWQEIMGFFAGAVGKLTENTGNNINGDSKIRVVISSSAYTTLKATFTDLGISVFEQITKTYPNMYFVSAVEFNGAYNNSDVAYFIGESNVGGISDTTKLGYSELALMGNVVNSDYGYSQAMSAGTCGALIFKPLFIVRYSGI